MVKIIKKNCEKCGVEIEGTVKKKYCEKCAKEIQKANVKKWN